jgi:hypothetical protein
MEDFVEKKADLSAYLSNLKSADLAECLSILRQPILKLSETNLSKALFNTWKREKIINTLIIDGTERQWNKFSILDLVILNVINILWEHDIPVQAIKNTLALLLDGKGIRNDVNDIMDYPLESTKSIIDDDSNLNLLEYIVNQKKKNPQLPFFTNIESYIIGSLKLNRPFSILVKDNGRIELFTTDSFKDMLGSVFLNDLLSNTVLNISIRSVLEKILMVTDTSSLRPRNRLIEKLIESGCTAETVNELFGKRTDLKFKEKTIENPQTVSIANLIKEYSNQDIIIKIRDSQKKSIKQIIITKNQ